MYGQVKKRSLSRRRSGLWLIALCLYLPSAVHAGDESRENPVYTFAVVPQYTPLTVHRRWRPLLDELSKQAGFTFQLRIYDNFNEFLEDLKQGRADFTYLAPYHLVLARRAQGYIPLLRSGSTNLEGIVVVAKNSPYQNIRELDGKQIDFPSPNAFAASLFLRAYLQEHENISFTPRYLNNHDNVYRHVGGGFSEAGGGVNTTLSRQPAGLQARLRVLFRIPAVASHPVAVHPRVPAYVREKFVKLITTWVTSGKSQDYLDRVQLGKPVMADYDNDYASLESLKLEKYLVEGGGL